MWLSLIPLLALLAAACSPPPRLPAVDDASVADMVRLEGRPPDSEAPLVCERQVTSGTPVGAPVVLSEAAASAFLPVVVTRGETALIAWHEFLDGKVRVVYRLARRGCVGAARLVGDSLPDQKQVSAASTERGFVLAYEAGQQGTSVIRSLELDELGRLAGGPETVAPGWRPRLAAAGDQLAWVWTDGQAHFFALRGSAETVAPRAVGTQLLSGGLLNFPRVALDGQGTLHLAYRDGGPDSVDWEVLVVSRPRGGGFSAPVNVSRSPGLTSDDVALALDDGRLELAWVDQDGTSVDSFEVHYATRDAGGAFSTPQRYGTQGLWSWTPALVPGLQAAWRSGAGGSGPFHLSKPGQPVTTILPGISGSSPALARDSAGALHLAVSESAESRRVLYAIGPGL